MNAKLKSICGARQPGVKSSAWIDYTSAPLITLCKLTSSANVHICNYHTDKYFNDHTESFCKLTPSVNGYIFASIISTQKCFDHRAEKYLQIWSGGCLYLQSSSIYKHIQKRLMNPICAFRVNYLFIIHWPHFPFKLISPTPPLYKRWHREVRYVTLFLDHFFEKQENSLIIEEDQMSLFGFPDDDMKTVSQEMGPI